jgi:hypothetical protein
MAHEKRAVGLNRRQEGRKTKNRPGQNPERRAKDKDSASVPDQHETLPGVPPEPAAAADEDRDAGLKGALFVHAIDLALSVLDAPQIELKYSSKFPLTAPGKRRGGVTGSAKNGMSEEEICGG